MKVNSKILTTLKTSDFFYELPEELIAQFPAEKRDNSRLMVLDKLSGVISHKYFFDILDYLNKGDVLVVNRSKVIPARLFGEISDTGAVIELLLLNKKSENCWETLVKPGKKCKVGIEIVFAGGELSAKIAGVLENGNRIVDFNAKNGSVDDAIHAAGQMPLPPYITTRVTENDRYQTVYAKEEGSSAAPTAGLHFTSELLEKIAKKGVKIVSVLLHVGLGTFRPVKVKNISEHIMHSEWFSISAEDADIINNRKGRLFAVGTTSCRVLESVADENGVVKACEGETAIFIYPPYKFKAVDALVTNFHLPESTLIMLVSAFATKDIVLGAYESAIANKYRFFSFGDAMLIT